MPSEFVEPSGPDAAPDRRARKRAARREVLLGLAAEIVARDGLDGLTMAALADAADYAPASLYTYFPSRSALASALQVDALRVLEGVATAHGAEVDAALAEADPPARVAALARLLAFSGLFLSAPEHHPRAFRLQQALLVTPGTTDTDDALAVVPVAMAVLEHPRRLLAAAAEAGALAPHHPVADPLDHPLDGALVRTFSWVVALNGALLVDGITAGLPTTGALLGEELTDALLRGWGADPAELAAARAVAAALPAPRPAPEAAP